MKQLRDSDAQIYFHDESWVNLGDVRKNIWICEGKERFCQNDGKGRFNNLEQGLFPLAIFHCVLGKRLAISALISPQGCHHDSVDIFVCSEEHNMDSDRFIN